MKRPVQALLALCASAAAHASTIDSTDKFAYAQSMGWVNLLPEQSGGGEGVTVTPYHLSGKGYGQSVGWVDFGDGTPQNGLRYSNANAGDCGVNVDYRGYLSGCVYSQSVGWINFGWASSSDTNRPRLDLQSGVFSGYAYAQSAGWINLGAGFLLNESIALPPDSDGDGLPDAWELVTFGDLSNADANTDSNSNGTVDAQEFSWFRSLDVVSVVSDSDGDGFTDREEILASTSPVDQFSQPGAIGTTIGGDRYAYAQSAGWLNFRPGQSGGGEGVTVTQYHLGGKGYGQSVGWINFGSGNPVNGLRYSNTSATDCGVNLDVFGNLSGYAYGQSIGWIHFGWASASDPNRPRVNVFDGTFSGYAYAQSIGWINLGAGFLRTQQVLFLEDTDFDALPDAWEIAQTGNLFTLGFFADTDGDGIWDRLEFQGFRSLTFANATSDYDGDGATDGEELLAGTSPYDAQSMPPNNSNITTTDTFVYGQSVGWINLKHDKPSAPSGIAVSAYRLRGTAYGQSIGWISFGNGHPTNGLRYSNTSAGDCGVNIDYKGDLTGYAYAQSVGWIHFGWASPSDPDRPRLNLITLQFEGYAYGQSIGWIKLGDFNVGINLFEFVPDSDTDGLLDAWEIAQAGNLSTLNFASDSDGDGIVDREEFRWFRAIDIANATSDTDGDGKSDAQEILLGSNPTDAFSLPPGSGTNVSIDFAYVYGQSVGWINAIHNQPGYPSGLHVRDSHIKGEAWGQSVGWIHFGNGSPIDGRHYSNTTTADVGVNVDDLGNLSGYAYGQSCGWINFGWAASNDPDRPRINFDTGFLEGYAYGQSVGWVHLGSLKLDNLERPDNDFDRISDAWEILRFGNTFSAGFGTDADQDGFSDVSEYLADTDPLNGASHLLATPQLQGGLFQLTFPSTPTRRYTIEASTTLIDWIAIPPLRFAPDAGTSTTKLIPMPSGETKEFYRVNATLPLSGGGGIGIGIGP